MSTTTNHHARKAPRLRRLAVTAAMLAGMIASLVVISSPASAVSGLREIAGASAYNSVSHKSLSIGCPAFHHAIGGSAYIYGSDKVRILAAVPSGAGTSGSGFGIVANEQEAGTTENWRINGTVICAPASSLPGLEYRTAQSSFDSAATHQAKATCSPGKKLIGLGGEAWYNNLSDRSQVVLTGIRPNSSATEVTVTGHEDETGFGGSWRVYATAVCVTPIPGLQPVAVAAVDGFDTDPSKLAYPQCPSTTRVHSLGFDLTGPSGAGGEMHLQQLYNAGPLGAIWAVEDDNGLAGSWRLRGYAICAN